MCSAEGFNNHDIRNIIKVFLCIGILITWQILRIINSSQSEFMKDRLFLGILNSENVIEFPRNVSNAGARYFGNGLLTDVNV